MAQLTIYLEDEVATQIKKAAKESQLSQSKWVSQLIRNRLTDSWPTEIEELAGTWKDFPEVAELREGLDVDASREVL
jgi:hypothetical protein